MKITSVCDYEYEKNGITEENGYKKYYDWNVVKKHTRFLNIAIWICVTAGSLVFDFTNIAGSKAQLILIAGICFVLHVFVFSIFHEILHLLVFSKGKLDNNCEICLSKTVFSAIYKGPISRKCQIASLLSPVTFFAAVFSVAALFTSGILQFAFSLLLIMAIIGSYTDIYMVFYVLKNVEKDDIIYGLYKKSTPEV